MKTISHTLALVMLIASTKLHAQVELGQQVVSSFNMLAQDSQGISYSICVGQPEYTTETGTAKLVCQGFEQADRQFCPGDFTNDGVINTNDLLLMLALFGCLTGTCDDINQDGVFNVIDLLLFMALMGTSCDI